MTSSPVCTSSWTGAPPRFATERTPGRDTIGRDVVAVAKLLGLELMPWQQGIAMIAGELIQDPDTGLIVPAYPEVGVTVPRQSGKTTLYLAWITQRLFRWKAFDGRPQQVAYTAQTGHDARKKFNEDMVPLLERSRFGKHIAKHRRAAENTGLELGNGGTVSVWATSAAAGHGQTIDLGVLDELFKDEDGRREQAMQPAMATRHDSQKLWCSTAGDEKAIVLARKVAAGREAVRDGRNTGVAFFEWSADPDADPESPATWQTCMPALGYTISERTIRAALDQSRATDPTLKDFVRAYLNVSPADVGAAGVVPLDAWRAVENPRHRAGSAVVLAADATKRLDGASVAVADAAGTVEIVEHREGTTEWVLERVAQIARRHKAKVAVDVAGPLGYLADKLRGMGVEVAEVTTRDVCHASQDFRASVADGRVKVRTHAGLAAAVEAAAIRPVGESWCWSRATMVDASPLLAATLAYAVATVAVDTYQPFAVWAG